MFSDSTFFPCGSQVKRKGPQHSSTIIPGHRSIYSRTPRDSVTTGPLPALTHGLLHWARTAWSGAYYAMCLSLRALLTIFFIAFHILATVQKELLRFAQAQLLMKGDWRWDEPRWEAPQNQSENFSWNNDLGVFLSLGRISVCKWEIM